MSGPQEEFPRRPGTRTMAVFAPVVVAGTVEGIVGVPSNPPPMWVMLRELWPTLVWFGLGLLGVGAVVTALLIFRPAHKRLRTLEQAARALGEGRTDVRATEGGGDEVSSLAHTFNRMADDLQSRANALAAADRARRQLLADVSHELMTPLSAIRGYVETLAMPEVGLGLSGVNVYYRDVRYVLPFVLQLGLFASPVVYSLGGVPASWRGLYEVFNPLAAAIDGLRRIVPNRYATELALVQESVGRAFGGFLRTQLVMGLVFGLGMESKVILVFLLAFFSVIVSTVAGVRSVAERHLDLARSFGASRWLEFRSVILPSTFPFMLTGTRIATGRALVGVIVAEELAANEGIGHYIELYGQLLQTQRAMLGVIILGLFGILFGEGVRRIEKRFEAWRPEIH